MDAKTETLIPAAQLARDNPVRIANESAEYRAARTALLAEEIELRRHIERVAAQRRSLPPGGAVTSDYHFQGEDGPTDFAGLFGDKQTRRAASDGVAWDSARRSRSGGSLRHETCRLGTHV